MRGVTLNYRRAALAAFAGAGLALSLASDARPASRPFTTAAPAVCEASWRDGARDRDVPVRIRIPDGTGPIPVILFSHGLGGSLDAGTAWGEAWARAGFAVIHLQHAGSDEALWRGQRPGERLNALRTGMSAGQLIARAADVAFVLDELARRPAEGRCDLNRIDRSRVGMSGHSFGAHTTQAVAGQRFPGAGGMRAMRDPRIRAAVAFSPAPPRAADDVVRAAFAAIEIPFFSITGTRDAVPALNDVSPADRTLPHRYLPPGQKYLLVFDGAEHADFGGNAASGARRGGDAHVSEVVKRATTEFWRATLLDDPAARKWLEDGSLRAMLARGDRYEAR
jgi:predicted dienelactone hydrolase